MEDKVRDDEYIEQKLTALKDKTLECPKEGKIRLQILLHDERSNMDSSEFKVTIELEPQGTGRSLQRFS